MSLRRVLPSLLFLLVALGAVATDARAQARFDVYGGITPPNGDFQLRQYGWLSHIVVVGSGFAPGAGYELQLHGPLNTLGVSPTDRVLPYIIYADPFGSLDGFAIIPYDTGQVGYLGQNLPDIPRPGRYEVRAIAIDGSASVLADHRINLCPETVPGDFGGQTIFWSRSRGGRDGWMDDHSPERLDPEWMSVWSRQPVALYATVAATDADGANQPAFISHQEIPSTHYAHDINLELVPDDEYRWVLATANFTSSIGAANYGRIEFEWEAQNAGNPFTYGQGDIGMPMWAMPTAGDRVYTVGRWNLDNGHPDSGDRSEIHPARMLATMRKRFTAVPLCPGGCMTRARQVDVFVSGHGGGANVYYDGLEDLLDNGGVGGGRIEDYMPNLPGNSLVYDTYRNFGPSDDDTALFLAHLFTLTAATVWSVAGPSGIATDGAGLPNVWDHAAPPPAGFTPWNLGPEKRPVSDMDYDFDVPLPPPPSDATRALCNVTTHPEDTATIVEEITYTNPDRRTGLPTTAHVHLPYRRATNDPEYARTLTFYWDTFNPPGKHFVVRLTDVKPVSVEPQPHGPGRWNLWTDVSGQWAFLTGLDLAGFTAPDLQFGSAVGGIDGPAFDVYLDPDDTLRVFTMGYEAHSFDSLFGVDVGLPAYQAGVHLAEHLYFDDGDSVDLGGALFDQVETPPANVAVAHSVTASPIDYTFVFDDLSVPAHTPVYSMDFTATYVPSPPHVKVEGVPAAFGGVCLGSSEDRTVRISNLGEEPLVVVGVTVAGAGYSVKDPAPVLPYFLSTGEHLDVAVTFAPTAIDQGAGTITIVSTDPAQPSLAYDLAAVVDYPRIAASAGGATFPPTVLGCASHESVTIANTGTCDLIVSSASIVGPGYSLSPTSLPLDVPAGSGTSLDVIFAPGAVAHALTGVLTLGTNDPVSPASVFSFCGEGVRGGVRVLVLQADGTPYPMVDQILVTAGPPMSNASLKNVPLATVAPPDSCEDLRFDADIPLEPTNTGGQNGSSYNLMARVKNLRVPVTFTLGACELEPITVTLP